MVLLGSYTMMPILRWFLILVAGVLIPLALALAHCLSPIPTLQVPIYVNQLGYTPDAPKVAVAADPQTGFNAAEAYTPPATLQVRRVAGNQLVFTVTPTAWSGGATHTQSGDRVWWIDFSALTTPGQYYLFDPSRNRRSDFFAVQPTAYTTTLRQVLRMFYYQRSGQAKAPPYTDTKWADSAAFLGTNQDTQARNIQDPTNAATARDVRGGWFDAGDYNKYTIWATYALTDLLLAYLQYPSLWSDDLNIPESGNGIPDLLDEAKWELDWLLRMQAATGNNSVLSKVAVTGTQATSPPSADTNPRYWGVASTASTACTASVFALGAIAFSQVGQTSYATTLTTAATNAWTWAQANPSVGYANTGFGSANPEPSVNGRALCQLQAAVFLYSLTGTGTYRDFVDAHYTDVAAVGSTYWYSFPPDVYGQQALLYYSSLAGATSSVKTAIQSSKTTGMGGSEFYGAVTSQTDAYRAYIKDGDYVWGSNKNKAHIGLLFLDQVRYGLDSANATNYTNAAAGYLHYLLGVNPMGLVYLTNMYAYGAVRSANEMNHAWFDNGTPWDNALSSPSGPAPGYLVGGANPKYGVSDCVGAGTAAVSPPAGQPIQKSYKDWNTVWNGSADECSYTITEPSIQYQAALVHFLAHFVANP
jgi:endoglucanase